jgi:hypothetical protein
MEVRAQAHDVSRDKVMSAPLSNICRAAATNIGEFSFPSRDNAVALRHVRVLAPRISCVAACMLYHHSLNSGYTRRHNKRNDMHVELSFQPGSSYQFRCLPLIFSFPFLIYP